MTMVEKQKTEAIQTLVSFIDNVPLIAKDRLLYYECIKILTGKQGEVNPSFDEPPIPPPDKS